MVDPSRLVLLRHGRTEWNDTGRLQGHADVELDSVGLGEVERAAEVLSQRDFAAIYSSDLLRATRTADAVAGKLGLPVLLDERLREIDVGSWAGMTRADVEEIYPEYATNYFAGLDFRRSETGETIAEMVERAVPAIEEILARHEGRDVLVVAHGLLLSKIIPWLVGIEPEKRILGGMANAHWAEIGISDVNRWLISYNVGA